MSIINPDSYDKFFCKCNGSGNSFLDSCASPKSITANGAATQLPIKLNKSAGFFNGTTDYVALADSADWQLGGGTGSFTLEAFIFLPVLTGNHTIVGQGNDGSAYWSLDVYNNTHINFKDSGGININSGALTGLSANAWNHVALTRSGNTWNFWINGTKIGGDISNTGTVTDHAKILVIGGNTQSGYSGYLSGWIKELRISDSARYSANFTPSTTAFTSDANTKLLMHFDTTANSPLGPAIAFDGTGDYLSVPNGGSFDVGTGDFTYDIATYTPTGTADSSMCLFDSGVNNTKGIYILMAPMSATPYFRIYLNGSQKLSFDGTGTWGGKWNNWRAQRSGGNLKIFRNGKLEASVADTTNITANSAVATYIGARADAGVPYTGYIREIRFSNLDRDSGAVYTPSQSGFTVDANTKLYIKGDEDNGVTTFVDSETTAKTVTTAGDAKIKYTEDYRSCIFKDETGKFPYPVGSAKVDFFAIGDGCYYGDGANGTYLSLADSADWDMTDFTIECFFRTPGNGNYNLIDFPSNELALAFYGNNASYTFDGTVNNTRVNQAVPVPPINTWTHYRLVRSGTNAYCFVNGTLVGTTNVGTDAISPSALNIGSNGSWGSGFLGLMDNIRISNIARATATHNPPEDFQSWAGYSQILWLS